MEKTHKTHYGPEAQAAAFNLADWWTYHAATAARRRQRALNRSLGHRQARRLTRNSYALRDQGIRGDSRTQQA